MELKFWRQNAPSYKVDLPADLLRSDLIVLTMSQQSSLFSYFSPSKKRSRDDEVPEASEKRSPAQPSKRLRVAPVINTSSPAPLKRAIKKEFSLKELSFGGSPLKVTSLAAEGKPKVELDESVEHKEKDNFDPDFSAQSNLQDETTQDKVSTLNISKYKLNKTRCTSVPGEEEILERPGTSTLVPLPTNVAIKEEFFDQEESSDHKGADNSRANKKGKISFREANKHWLAEENQR